ncbi:16182_t:CDS:2 [Funneliformis geosporum]|nr:16182_t:CDS:2 [Funneliformis geosporum]
MTNLHIQAKPQKDLLNLKVVSKKEKFPTWVEKKEGQITLISEEKTYYLYLDKQAEDYNFHKIYNFFANFSQSQERSLNIDIKSFVNDNLNEETVLQAISEGILFGSHQTISYKEEPKNKKEILEIEDRGEKYKFWVEANKEKNLQIIKIKKIPVYYLITANKKTSTILNDSLLKLEAVNFARDLQDTPPNKLHAKEFAEIIKNKLATAKGIQVDILDKKAIEKNKMGLLLAVNAGSHHEPRVVILRYKGNPKSKETLGLIGKGITFDSGGYDLKPSQYLQGMKFDMSGAAIVCASFLALTKKQPKINMVAVACLTENAIGGHATLTESVATSMSGKTVEINNTDAEGRLVLADGITYAIQKEKVTKIITLATLTGAVIAALGENLTGILTNHRKFYRELRKAFNKSRERY